MRPMDLMASVAFLHVSFVWFVSEQDHELSQLVQ